MRDVDVTDAHRGGDGASLRGIFNLQVDGGTLRCRVTGSGPAVVLVHGNTFDLRMWAGVHEALSSSYTSISYDLRGYGKSSVPVGPYSHIEDLRAVTAALTDGPCAFVGLSMGGRIAVDFALTHPEKVNQLVLVGSGISGWQFQGELAATFASVREIARRDGWPAAQSAWLASPLLAPTAKHPAARHMLRQMVQDYSGWHFLHDDPVVGPHPAALTRLSAVEAETLVVTGNEEMAELAGMSDRLAREIPNSRQVKIDQCGHQAPLEHPETFARVLLAFLR